MKTTLPKKSQAHQLTIEQITAVIKEEGKDKIAFIILFGSFARGDWVSDFRQEKDGSYASYDSDYDILIITKRHQDAGRIQSLRLQNKIENKIKRKHLDRRHWMGIIIESLDDVNKSLRRGQYFFSDIKEEGILLYSSGDKKLDDEVRLSNEERKEIAIEDYERWFGKAEDFLDKFQLMFNKEKYNSAAFDLHQATESLFSCTLLVFTNYRPKSHDILILNNLCKSQHNDFINIFPKSTKAEQRLFELLRRAYVEARYSKDYAITKTELEYLISKVEKLKKIVEKNCLDKIKSFTK